MTDRKQNHDRRGRAYEGSLAERVDKAGAMIGKMCAEGRPPKMSVPAGDCFHWTPCGDEDIFIVDLLKDLLAATKNPSHVCAKCGLESIKEGAE